MKKYRKIYIEITNKCNLNCSFCPKTKRAGRTMSAEEFAAVANAVRDRGVNYYLHLMGEPTSHPEFEKILKICRENKMAVNITTNGTLLDKTGDIMLENNVRMVSVSMHSFEANSLNKDMAAYLEKITDFCKKARKTDTITELRLWNFDRESIYDKNRLNGQILLFLQENLKLDFDLPQAVAKTLEEKENSNQRKFNIKLTENVFLGMAEHFMWPDINRKEKNDCGFCYGLRNQVAILANGDVVPCCLDSDGNMVLGNIFTQNFDDIIKGQRALAIYNGFSNRRAVEPLCQTCGYMQMHLKNPAVK